jgi:hypothetical protein
VAADGGGLQGYWALSKAQDLADAVLSKEREYFDAARRRGLDRIWQIAYAQAFGTDPMNPQDFATQTLSYVGPEGKALRFRINEPRSLVAQANILARGERVAFKCLALNSDLGAGAQVEIAQQIVQYLYSENIGTSRETELMDAGAWFGAGFWWTTWDADGGDDVDVEKMTDLGPTKVKQRSGAPRTTTLFPWEYCQEPYAKDPMWGIVRERMSKYELAAEFPALADKIIGVNNIRSQQGLAEMFLYDVDAATTDDVIVRHFYLKPCRAAKYGRYCGVLEDMVLWDRPCPHPKKIPIVEYCPYRYFGTRFAYAKSWDILSLQEAVDELVSQMLTNFMTFGRQNVFVPAGTNFDEDALADGQNIFTIPSGSTGPVALALAAMPEGANWLIEFCYQRMNSIMGMNAVARGESDETVKSGTHAALRDSLAIRFQNSEHAAFVNAQEEQANLSLDMTRQYSQTDFVVEIAGAGEESYLKQFAKSSVAGVRKVRVAVVSPMMQSQAGRLETFMAVSKLPKEERAGAIRGIEMGDFTGFTEKPKTTDMLIRFENEQMLKGIVVKPVAGENPMLHMPEHWSALEKILAQPEPDPVAVKVLTDHMFGTIQTWQGSNPFWDMFLKVAPPPPLPGTPAGELAMMGFAVPPSQDPDGEPAGGPPGGEGAPERDANAKSPAGPDIPKPAKPPANASPEAKSPQPSAA